MIMTGICHIPESHSVQNKSHKKWRGIELGPLPLSLSLSLCEVATNSLRELQTILTNSVRTSQAAHYVSGNLLMLFGTPIAD